jgi:hypothetical protein
MVGFPCQRGTPRSARPQYKNSRAGSYPIHTDISIYISQPSLLALRQEAILLQLWRVSLAGTIDTAQDVTCEQEVL